MSTRAYHKRTLVCAIAARDRKSEIGIPPIAAIAVRDRKSEIGIPPIMG